MHESTATPTARSGPAGKAIAALPPLASPLGAVLGRGKSATVYALGPDTAAKVFEDHWHWAAIKAELAAARCAWAHDVQTPRPLALVQAQGRPAIVFERVDGTDVGDVMRRQPWAARRLLRAMVALQVCIHLQPGVALRTQAAMLGFSIRQRRDAPERCREGWARDLEALGGSALSHNDFHVHNLLLRGNELVVIDWGKGATGDALLDAALAYLKLRSGSDAPGLRGEVATRAASWLAERYASDYLRRTCQSRDDFEQRLPLAAASLVREPSAQ